MSSASGLLGKPLSTPPSTSHTAPAPQASASASNFESSSRRPSNSQTGPSYAQSGAGNARKTQALRKQHRQQRRPGPSFRDPDDDDAMAELRAVRNPSSRRGQTSITHLMSYALPPRPGYHDHHHGSSSRSYRRNPSWGPGSGYHAADKARYVHANYRFVVSPTTSYATQAADADEHLDWADVMQVLASAESQQASCPICLSEPVAPRMAKCGHIFCLPCIIRFMNSSNGDDDSKVPEKKTRWKKCPICEDSIYMPELRPLRFYAGQESPLPRPGEDVVLRLMMRNARSTLALPREGGADVLNSDEDVPWHFAANVLDYARIMKGTGGYMEEQYDLEIEDLMRQEKEDELLFHEDNEWTQKAIKAISAAKEKTKGVGAEELAVSTKAAAVADTPSRHVEQDFYFYTTPPHLYLSPLDIRILKTKYGSFSSFPSTLLPRVEHISTGHAVDDALRRRAKYLGHLPHGCLIGFLECDWTDIVPAEILNTFAEEIERRRKRNRDKSAQEERERLQAERVEAAAIRSARRMLGSIDEDVTVRFSSSATRAAAVDLDEFIPLGATTAPEAATTPPNPRPGFSHLAQMSTSPSAHRTVWGTPAVAKSPELGPREPQLPTDDGWLRDDQLLESQGDAELALQIEALAFETGGASGTSTPGKMLASGDHSGSGVGEGGGGKKKKKKQKITLMSTGGRRGT